MPKAGEQDWGEFTSADGVPYYYNRKTQETTWDKPEALKTDADLQEMKELFWIPDETNGYQLASFCRDYNEKDKEFQLENGKKVMVPKTAQVCPVMKSSLAKIVDDLVQMDIMNEPMVCHNLHQRFLKDKIYTNIGTILISVNPFKSLPLYLPSIIQDYSHRGTRELPPHPFSIADAGLRSLISDGLDQAVLISGESGAGKTEATKVVLMYLAEVAGSVGGVENKILQANPILEAFGNAKTVRNNNSSRFGKWVEIHFNKQGAICGAKTVNYLLEKSRVVHQSQGERNYHIFYMLCAGLRSQDPTCQVQLNAADTYKFLSSSGCVAIDGLDDSSELKEMIEAMNQMGFDPEERFALFETTSAVLMLGNVKFNPSSGANGEEGSVVGNPELVEQIAKLLCVDTAALTKALVSRMMQVRKEDPPMQLPLTPHKAEDSCNALAKSIYGAQFDWIVQRINTFMQPSEANTKMMGVLDIFGFEIFETNSFEQLCINFANEKLQQHFNNNTFKLEEAVYESEQIRFTHVEFIDNQPTLDLIEKKPAGLLPMLDEEVVLPKTTDDTFLKRLNTTHGKTGTKHPNFIHLLRSQTAFAIKHYAGDVQYEVEGFLDKNRDTLYQDLVAVMQASGSTFVSGFFPAGQASAKGRKATLGSQFKDQLSSLMTRMNQCNPHYIRCVKPNSLKAPNNFNGAMCLQQLRYAGVFEAVRIRQTGYPFRHEHDVFFKRFRICDKTIKPSGDAKKDAVAMLNAMGFDTSKDPDLQVGCTRILYRSKPHRSLELKRNVAIEARIVRTQCVYRAWRARVKTEILRKARPILRAAIDNHLLEPLEAAIAQHDQLWFEIKELKDARRLRFIIIEELRLKDSIAKLLTQGPEESYETLSEEVEKADGIGYTSPDIEKARKQTAEIRVRREAIAELQAAADSFEEERIRAAIARADELNIDMCPQKQNAVNNLKHIETEKVVCAEMQAALNSGYAKEDRMRWDHNSIDTAPLDASIKKAAEHFCSTKAGVELYALAQFMAKLRATWKKEEWSAVDEILAQAALDSIECDEVKEVRNEVAHRTKVKECGEKLDTAVTQLDEDGLAYNIEIAVGLRMDDPEVPSLSAAKRMHTRIVATKAAIADALSTANIDKLNAAIDDAASYGYDTDAVRKAIKTRDDIVKAKEDLMRAMSSGGTNESDTLRWDHQGITTEQLEAALQFADQLDLNTEEGRVLLQRATVIRDLRKALQAEEWDGVSEVLIRAGLMGLSDNGEVLAAQKELDHRAAVADCTAKLQQSIAELNQDMITYNLQVAESLRMHEPVLPIVAFGRAMLAHIIDTRERLVAATQAVRDDMLTVALCQADAFNFHNSEVDAARALLARIAQIKEETAYALGQLERPLMEKAVKDAHDIRLEYHSLEEIRKVLKESEESFLQLQLQVARDLGQNERCIKLMISIKDKFLGSHGAMFVFSKYPALKTPDMFADEKLLPLGKEKLMLGMLCWTKNVLHTSLTRMEQLDIKTATKLHKSILGFMGDIKAMYPDQLASEVCRVCEQSKKMRDEAYCQILKQLTDNPNPESVSKGWNLLERCLGCFSPSDDFSNYLEVYLRAQRPELVPTLHEILYRDQKLSRSTEALKQSDPIGRFRCPNNIPPHTEKARRPPTQESLDNGTLDCPMPQMTGTPGAGAAASPAAIPPPTQPQAIPQPPPPTTDYSEPPPPPPPAAVGYPEPPPPPPPAAEAFDSTPPPPPPPPVVEEEAPPPPPPPPAAPPPPKITRALANYPFQASDSSQLSFGSGDHIEILEADCGDGWALGMLNGVEGYFPAAYVQFL